MCRAGPASRKVRRMSISVNKPVHATNTTGTSCQAESIKSPKTALHEKCRETHSTADDSSQGSSYLWQMAEEEMCPVTGCFSDILDDYHVFSKVLGSGHYGSVRECVHRTTRQVFAVKSIDKSKVSRHDHLRREVTLLRKVNHEGIMKMVDCYEDSEFVHIVTEKYSGGELFDKIVEHTNPEGCFSEARAAKIIKSLLESVRYLHKNGIVHRDIKPENILLESKHDDSDVKLIDFGLSRTHAKGDAPMSNSVGTAYYMSPELLKGKYDKSCDVWSAGVVAYILLCGYPPFNGDSDPDIFDAIKKGRFDFPEQGWNGVSSEAKDFIKCLLRRDPRKRFTAVEALQHPWVANVGCAEKVDAAAKLNKLRIRARSVRQM